MQTKENTIKLVTPSGKEQDFSIKHAENLLSMGGQFNGGWKIATGEKYIYDKKNGIRVKTSKGNSAKAE